MTLTQNKLHELLDYSIITGNFYWKVKPSRRVKAGAIAGTSKGNKGYVDIRIKRKAYQAHRLVWLYLFGKYPDNVVDHINGVKTDNSWINLRDITHSQNLRNCGLSSRNTSGYKGVSYMKGRNMYSAHIGYKGKQKYLGCFKEPKEAYKAYCEAAKELHGEYANVS